MPKHKKFESKTINLKILPDTTTLVWKNNGYRQDEANKNVCIRQDGGYNWLCSNDLPSDGEFVFTIKVDKHNYKG